MTRSALLSLALLVSAISSSNNAAEQANTAAPEQGRWATTPDESLPNVLILGDSISIGYTLQVRQALAGKANVFRPIKANGQAPENCEGTSHALKHIDRWLAGRKWDVIHFNWGLHDLKRVKQAGSSANSSNPDDPYQATVEQYEKNMGVLVAKLKATGAKLIFATTTPIVEGSAGPYRAAEDPSRYNDRALRVIGDDPIEVNDLFALCERRLDELQIPKNVHFTRAGSEALAQAVTKHLLKALPREQ